MPEPDRRRDGEPGVRGRQQHARRRKRVEAQESRAGQERQRDQGEPSVAMPSRGDVRHVGEDGVHRGRQQDEPEVARLVIPFDVELRLREQQGEPDEGQRKRDGNQGDPGQAIR